MVSGMKVFKLTGCWVLSLAFASDHTRRAHTGSELDPVREYYKEWVFPMIDANPINFTEGDYLVQLQGGFKSGNCRNLTWGNVKTWINSDADQLHKINEIAVQALQFQGTDVKFVCSNLTFKLFHDWLVDKEVVVEEIIVTSKTVDALAYTGYTPDGKPDYGKIQDTSVFDTDVSCQAGFQLNKIVFPKDVQQEDQALVQSAVNKFLESRDGPVGNDAKKFKHLDELVCQHMKYKYGMLGFAPGTVRYAFMPDFLFWNAPHALTVSNGLVNNVTISDGTNIQHYKQNHDLIDGWINFTDTPGMPVVEKISKEILSSNGPYSIDRLLEWAFGPTGSVDLKEATMGSLIQFPVKLRNLDIIVGKLNITLYEIHLQGLNSLSTLEVLNEFPADIGINARAENLTVSVTTEFSLQFADNAPFLANEHWEGNVTADFNFALGIKAQIDALLNGSYLETLKIDQLVNRNCLSNGVFTFAERWSQFDLGKMSTTVKLHPHNYSSALAVGHAVGNLMDLYVNNFNSTFFPALTYVLREEVNSMLDEFLNVTDQCPAAGLNSTVPQLSSAMANVAFGTALLALLVAAGGIVHHLVGGAKGESDPMSTPALSRADTAEGHQGSLALHPRLSRPFSFFMCLMVLTAIVMFVSSNCGASVLIKIQVLADGKEAIHLPSVYSFSLGNSVSEMWDKGAYLLAVMILLFSGVWPYCKLVAMLFAWFLPVRCLSNAKRLTMLSVLDALGKWSLVDSLVLILMMVGFQFELEPTKGLADVLSIHDIPSGKFKVYVEAVQGFYMFLGATFLSIIASHVMAGANRYAMRIGEYDKSVISATSSSTSRLCDVLRPVGRGGKLFAHLPVYSLVGNFILVCVGIWTLCFQFRFRGLAGFMAGDDAVRSFSAWSMGMSIPEAYPWPDNYGVRSLQATYMMYTIFIPIALIIVLLVLWSAPLTSKVQRRLFVLAQVLHAWGCLDVFTISLLASVLEIRKFVLNLVGQKFDVVNKLLGLLSETAKQAMGELKTFDLDSELKAGFFVLLVAVVINTIVNSFVLHKCEAALCRPMDEEPSEP